MSDDLRTLAQAVVSVYEMWQGERHASVGRDYAVIDDCRARYYEACGDVDVALALQHASSDISSARAILAALDAADSQGYARAMGDVVAEVQARTEAAVSSYYADRSSYREGYSDACDTLCELVQHMAQTKRD